MRNWSDDELAEVLDKRVFRMISEAADELGVDCYVVGGYVRDLFLERTSTDIDVVVVGSGIALAEALKRNGPTVIRYPRGKAPQSIAVDGDRQQSHVVIWATGDQLEKSKEIAGKIGGAEVVFARYLKPFDAELLKRQRAEGKRIVSIENGAVAGGFGEAIGADLKFGWPDEFIPHGSVAELEKRYGFDVESIVRRLNG